MVSETASWGSGWLVLYGLGEEDTVMSHKSLKIIATAQVDGSPGMRAGVNWGEGGGGEVATCIINYRFPEPDLAESNTTIHHEKKCFTATTATIWVPRKSPECTSSHSILVVC